MKGFTMRLRYLGVLPQLGRREYSFSIEDKEKSPRQVVLTIEDGVFLTRELTFQEAPDLCYQKLLTELSNETAEAHLPDRASVTRADIAQYRNSHPAAKARATSASRRME